MDRRRFFSHLSLGSLAMGSLLAPGAHGSLFPQAPHHRPRAKNVILLFMCGGASHLETFDHKPKLREWNGRLAKIFSKEELQQPGKIAGEVPHPPTGFDFRQHGQSGAWVSEIFLRLARLADEHVLKPHRLGDSFGRRNDLLLATRVPASRAWARGRLMALAAKQRICRDTW